MSDTTGGLLGYMAASPLPGVTLTLGAFLVAQWAHGRTGRAPWANPVAISVVIVAAILGLAGIPYEVYFDSAQFIHFLLGPATVALAVPLARLWPRLKTAWRPLTAGLVAGSVIAIGSGTTLVLLMGGDKVLAMSMVPKSATSPIAMSVAEHLGGLPSLAVSFTLVAGMIGAITGVTVLRLMRMESSVLGGFALGVASHGIGTARAFQVSMEMGAFAGLGMGLNGIATAVLAPWIAPVIMWLFG
ncbi:LrgB family protein [Kerstersia similis]|uniref:LrgB family protein n=1 Tax=Kerstersia similis TaxID=206505 RepID=UPI0039EFB67F